MGISASNIVNAINQLPRRVFNYVDPKNKGVIELRHITLPEGPIKFIRYNPSKGGTANAARVESIPTPMIWRLANAIVPGQPVNVDRVFAGSYNCRSVLESLLAHSPQFFFCFPGRIEKINSKEKFKPGHKHIMFLPDSPHDNGILVRCETDIVISEIPNLEVFYDSLTLPDELDIGKIDIDIHRRHAQIQVALFMIGRQLNFRTWIAQNDKGIIYDNKRIGEMDGCISSLRDEKLITAYDDVIKAAAFIDCIWFKNGRLMPAVMEVEHTTGITSGLTRMKNLFDVIPPFPTKYVIVAPDDDRHKVVNEANKDMFRDLNTRFFPYSAVEELYAICQRRKLRGITEDFLDCYMEPVVA